jgi:superfamily II DNA or RNA helicase
MQLRDYQKQIIKESLQAVGQGRNVLVVAPTGAGKSLIMSTIADIAIKRGKRVLIVAHRLKLLKQINETYMTISGVAGSILAPKFKTDYNNPLQLAMVQTLASKSRKLPENIDIILVDEAHLTTSFIGFERLLTHCNGDIWALGKTRLIGFTGTPFRNNRKEGLCRWFNHILQTPSARMLMQSGYLTTPEIYLYQSANLDLTHIKVDAATGDFNVKDMLSKCTPDYLQDVFIKWQSVSDKAKTIVFCASVEQATDMANIYNQNGYIARCVHGETSESETEQAYADFKSGMVQIITSVGKLTEGYDEPSIECVVLARPTRSLALGIQIFGRGTRLFRGKKLFTIIDCGGFFDHFINSHPDVFDITEFNIHPRPKMPGEFPTKQCPKCENHVRTVALICPHCEYQFPLKEKDISMAFFPNLIKLTEADLKKLRLEYKFVRKTVAKLFDTGGDIRDLEKAFVTKFKRFPNPDFMLGTLFNGNKDDLARSVFSHYLARTLGQNMALIRHYYKLEFGDDRLVKPFSPSAYLGITTPASHTTREDVISAYAARVETSDSTILNYAFTFVMSQIL